MLEEVVDLGGAFAQAVLDVDFLRAGAGEGGDDFEGVAEGGFVFLENRMLACILGGV